MVRLAWAPASERSSALLLRVLLCTQQQAGNKSIAASAEGERDVRGENGAKKTGVSACGDEGEGLVFGIALLQSSDRDSRCWLQRYRCRVVRAPTSFQPSPIPSHTPRAKAKNGTPLFIGLSSVWGLSLTPVIKHAGTTPRDPAMSGTAFACIATACTTGPALMWWRQRREHCEHRVTACWDPSRTLAHQGTHFSRAGRAAAASASALQQSVG